MRVVHAVGWYFPQNIGGTEIYVAAVVRELRHAGVDVCIAAPLPGASHPETYEHDGVPVYRYPIPVTPDRREARGEVMVRGAESFHTWLQSIAADVVHVHTFVTGLDLIEVKRARALGARVFVTNHSSALGYVCLRGTLLRWGTEPCDGITRPRACAACALQMRGVPRSIATSIAALPAPAARCANRVQHPVGTALGLSSYVEERIDRQRELFEHVDCVFALTDAAQSILVANGAPAAKVRVNRLGIEYDVIRRGEPRRRRSRSPVVIGYLGRFDPIKGVDDLLQAAESLPAGVPFRLDVRGVGNESAAERVRAACHAAARRDSRIQVGGPVERNEVADVLASWDVLCCPGLSLEGGPTVALEAFAVGTPVIGTGFGGLAEIVRDDQNGKLFTPGDWRALAEIIRTVAARPDVIDEWRMNIPGVRTMRDVAQDYLAAYSA